MQKKHFAIGSGTLAVGIAVSILMANYLAEPDWALHIAIFSVGQGDAIVIVAPDGDASVIDAGFGSTAGHRVADFLLDEEQNGVGRIQQVKLGFATHYDRDHIGGFDTLAQRGIAFRAFYDQGPSAKRKNKTIYDEYLAVVGDPNDNMTQDPNESHFVRKKARVGLHWKLGEAKVKCASALGDTKGSRFDLEGLDPSEGHINENPGSIALLVTYGDFEFYSAGDQTSDDWKHEPDTEIGVARSGVLGDDPDIDVIKVSHHGSDTSTGAEFVLSLTPEVAVISTKYTSGDENPKMVAVQQWAEAMAMVYVTGDGRHEDTGTFTDSSATTSDDGYLPSAENIVNDAGDVHIFVSADGKKYKVIHGKLDSNQWKEFSAVDADNARTP